MKIKGQRPEGPKPEIVVIPREAGDIIITCNPVFDFSAFDKLCPMPKPALITMKDGTTIEDVNDVKFVDKLYTRARRRTAWLILESLKGTPDLEWETINPSDPATWENVYTELRDAHFSDLESNKILQSVIRASAMDESRLDEARQRFIRSLQEGATKQ